MGKCSGTAKPLLGALTITVALAIQVHAQSFLTKGLVAYYPFNGNANDESVNANNGTMVGSTLTADRFGDLGKAMAFNGTSQYVQVPHQSYLNFPGGEFTLSIWLWLNEPAKTQFLLGKDMGRGNNSKWIVHYGPAVGYTTPLGISFHVVTPPSGTGYYAPSDTKFELGTWHQIVIRKTASSYAVYIDGRPVSSGQGPANLPSNNTAPLTFGQTENGAYFNGKMDDVRIYDWSLSDVEIQQLYTAESGPAVELIKAVKPVFSKLTLGKNYQLQLSGDTSKWTNYGQTFAATNSSMSYPQNWEVVNRNELFFRLQSVP